MKTLKWFSAVALGVVLLASFASAAAPWTRDFEAAKVRAKAENKPIFLYFTGSDWCGWCKKMEREILVKKEFLDFAAARLVLVELDYPRQPENKAKQSDQERAQNKALDRKFKIEGYPTIYLVDAAGELLPGGGDFALQEHVKGGPAGFVAVLKAFLDKPPAGADVAPPAKTVAPPAGTAAP
jgi:protein disulfide-isomerase